LIYYFSQAQQRVSDSWRSTIGSAALAIVNAFFDANEEFETNEARQEFATDMIENLGFLYENTDSEPFQGLFRGEFIIETFAAHFTAIRGAKKVPALGVATSKENRQNGGLAMSAAAVERAFALWENENITLESIEDSKRSGKALVLKLGRDGRTLKETAFNEHRWGEVTCEYLTSVKNVALEPFDEICDQAKTMSKSTRKGERSGSPSAEDDRKPAGRRALLVEA